MTSRQISLLLLCVLVAVAMGLPAVAAQETVTETATPSEPGNASATGEGLGTELTAFLQSSSAAANDTVENRMWQANFEQSADRNRRQLVTDRTAALEQRLLRLEQRNETLTQRYQRGNISRAAYVAQQSQLAARIDGLEAAVAVTNGAAAKVGVRNPRLQRLKESAGTVAGPDVAKVARVLGHGTRADRGTRTDAGAGPADKPGQGNGVEGTANQTQSANATAAFGGDQQGQSAPSAENGTRSGDGGSETTGNSTGSEADGNDDNPGDSAGRAKLTSLFRS